MKGWRILALANTAFFFLLALFVMTDGFGLLAGKMHLGKQSYAAAPAPKGKSEPSSDSRSEN
jgi:hypothetical protein